MTTSQNENWVERLTERLQLREALVQRGRDWVRERRDGLLFLHVSKSGGTSLDNFLSGFFPDRDVLPTEAQVRRIADWDAADWSRYKYFKLEWPYEPAAQRAPLLHFVTMFREPVQRIMSLYKHLRRPDDHSEQYATVRNRRTPEQESARRLSLRDWVALQYPQPGAYYRNPYLGMSTIGVWNMTSKTDAELDALLERGKANLREKFAFVGIIEEYLESQRLFCQTFGVPLHYAAHQERLNAAPAGDRDPTDDEAIELLRHENRWDVALYAFARELFAERCQALAGSSDIANGSDVARTFGTDRPQNGRGEQWIDALSGSGFHRVEHLPTGAPLRWTGALPQATLNLLGAWPTQGKVRVEVDLAVVQEPQRLGELQVRLDGRLAESITFESAVVGTRLIAECTLTDASAARTIHELELRGPLAAPSAGPDSTGESRRLGVAVQRVGWSWQSAAASGGWLARFRGAA